MRIRGSLLEFYRKGGEEEDLHGCARRILSSHY
jgi:hypothetical protein